MVMDKQPEAGGEVLIPAHIFSKKKDMTAKVIEIEGSDVTVELENGETGTCQIYEIPAFQLWCGEVIEKYMEEQK
jgi:hypothetical protein